MDWDSIGKVVGEAAPIIGTLLGGPAGGAVGSIVATVLGVENEPQKIAEVIKQDPDALLKLKEYEFVHKEELMRLQFQTLEKELQDKANARKEHKHSIMPAIITVMITVMMGIIGYAIFTYEIPVTNRDVAYMLFGQVSALWGASVTYWVGTTRSSADKTKILGK